MSTRQLLNLTTGALTTLLMAAVAIALTTAGRSGHSAVQIDLAARQQMLVQDLTQQVAALGAATSRDEVTAARGELGQTIVRFDQNLTALLYGGAVQTDAGTTVTVPRVNGGRARKAVEDGAQLWIDTGMPLSDLAAGEYSVFSAAGRQAAQNLQDNHVALMEAMGDAAGHLRRAETVQADVGGYARWAAGGLAFVLVVMTLTRRRRSQAAAADATEPGAPRVQAVPVVDADEAPRPRPFAPAAGSGPFTSSIDFDNVNAAVDQMSVDMNTIAGSTEKMRAAIDSVGFALQGMLFSLREMADDTAEGYKIVRGANNAATFTADAATELAESAREMGRVVSRVTQLALRTKQIASQIEGEAVHTGKTGEAFTSVVANEVRGLATQTNRATAEIDQTVSAILITAREYEEAIGQIIKNVAAINKVSQNLGKLMLDPPQRVVAGTPLPPPPALTAEPAAAAQPAPARATAPAQAAAPAQPAAVIEDDVEVPEPTPQEMADATSAAIADAAAAAPLQAGAAPAAAEPETPKADGGSNNNVFLLGKPRRPAAKAAPRSEAAAPAAEAPAPEAVAPQPAAEAAPAAPAAPKPAVDEPAAADGGSNNNVFLLNKPKGGKPKATETATAAEAPAAAPMPAPAAPAPAAAAPPPPPAPEPEAEDEEDSGSNIFMLNKPRKKKDSSPAAADAPPTAPAAAPDKATVPADAPAAADKPANQNVFLLNKPK